VSLCCAQVGLPDGSSELNALFVIEVFALAAMDVHLLREHSSIQSSFEPVPQVRKELLE